MAAGGPIESITINGRRFPTDGEDSAEINYGGYTNEVKANGDGSVRLVKSRVPASIEGLNIEISHDRGDHEYLKECKDENDFLDISITLCDGTVLAGAMQITDDLVEDTKEKTAGITLSGSLEKIG